MQVVDANVLLHAVNEDSARHERAHRWIDESLSNGPTVGFAWMVLAFLNPTTRHLGILRGLLRRPLV